MAKTFSTTDSDSLSKVVTLSPLAEAGIGAKVPIAAKPDPGEMSTEASTSTYETIPDDMTPVGEPTVLVTALAEARAAILGGMSQTSSIAYGVTLPPATPNSPPIVPQGFPMPSVFAPQAQRQGGGTTIVLAQAGVRLVGFRPQEVQALASLGRPNLAGAS